MQRTSAPPARNRRTTTATTLVGLLGLSAALAGCASPATGSGAEPASGAAASPSTSEAADEHEGHEDGPAAAASPRLVVTLEDGGALVIDAESGEQLGAVDTVGPARPYTAADGRHALLVQTDDGVVQALDGGSWSQAHGDHDDVHLEDPALLEQTLDGARPVHVVNHGGHTTVFDDGDGSAATLDASWFGEDPSEPEVVQSGQPQHGVAVPMDGGGMLITADAPEGGGLPETVRLVDADGDEKGRFPCPELHGEATSGEQVAFGCADGLLVVDGEDATTIEYPGGAPAQTRAGTVVAAGSQLLTSWAPGQVLAVDLAAGRAKALDLGSDHGPIAATTGGEGVALGTDGSVITIDLASSTVSQRTPAIAAWEKPEGHGSTTPGMVVHGTIAWVSDPATSTVTAIDLEAGTAAEPVAIDGVPSGLAVVGTAPVG